MNRLRRFWRFMLLGLVTGCGVQPAEHNRAGIGLYQQGDFPAAVRAYQSAQVSAPDQAEFYLNAGMAFAQLGDTSRAISAFNQALKTADEIVAAQVYYDLGNVYYQMRRFPDAIEAYEQALLRQPDNADARYNLELTLQQIVPPTPTPPPQATPESSGETPAPTLSPENNSVATPTQVPEEQATSETTGASNGLSADAAAQLLDAVQENQKILNDATPMPSDATPQQDW